VQIAQDFPVLIAVVHDEQFAPGNAGSLRHELTPNLSNKGMISARLTPVEHAWQTKVMRPATPICENAGRSFARSTNSRRAAWAFSSSVRGNAMTPARADAKAASPESWTGQTHRPL
jgi:hypothetical protein